ncbi:MAG: cytochrome C [Planctomycetes bacterium]|jgi:mono/diheme cytochrome c family protein|nr:cytochrome C [Planctomycetota bacterium]
MSSNWKSFLALFLPCILVLLALESLLRPNPRERNYEAFTEMVYSRAAESLSPSASLPGAMTQQSVAPGVVIRGQLPFHYGPGPEEAQRAGRELLNPYTDEPHVLARGAEIYLRFCTVCHAGDGGGQGPVVKRGMLPPPPLGAARALEIKDGEMFHVLTLGQGNMGSYAAQISAADRWKVIRHVRLLQESVR